MSYNKPHNGPYGNDEQQQQQSQHVGAPNMYMPLRSPPLSNSVVKSSHVVLGLLLKINTAKINTVKTPNSDQFPELARYITTHALGACPTMYHNLTIHVHHEGNDPVSVHISCLDVEEVLCACADEPCTTHLATLKNYLIDMLQLEGLPVSQASKFTSSDPSINRNVPSISTYVLAALVVTNVNLKMGDIYAQHLCGRLEQSMWTLRPTGTNAEVDVWLRDMPALVASQPVQTAAVAAEQDTAMPPEVRGGGVWWCVHTIPPQLSRPLLAVTLLFQPRVDRKPLSAYDMRRIRKQGNVALPEFAEEMGCHMVVAAMLLVMSKKPAVMYTKEQYIRMLQRRSLRLYVWHHGWL